MRLLSPLEINPKRVSFGRIRSASPTLYKYATILRGDGGPIAPEVLPPRQPGLDARICEIEPGSRYELVVSVTPPLLKSRFREVLRIKTGVREAPTMMINVDGLLAPRVEAVPNRLTFPEDRTEDSERVVHLRWDDGHPGEILGVETTIPDARVRIVESEKFQKVVVTVPVGAQRIAGAQTVTIRTSDSAAPTLYIPVSFRASPRRTSQGTKARNRTRSTKGGGIGTAAPK